MRRATVNSLEKKDKAFSGVSKNRKRRATLREIPGLLKAIYGNPSSFRLQIPTVLRKRELACGDLPKLPLHQPRLTTY